ncbi:MAG: hypothetical protein AAGU11_16885 [Syntrophobacteraceae bacterium]
MKTRMLAAALIISAGFTGTCLAEGTYSGRAVQESSRAVSHASVGAMYGVAASGQVVSAAAAVPFAIAGSVGNVSTRIAEELMDAANVPAGSPLLVTDEIVTAGPPPDQALGGKVREDG